MGQRNSLSICGDLGPTETDISALRATSYHRQGLEFEHGEALRGKEIPGRRAGPHVRG